MREQKARALEDMSAEDVVKACEQNYIDYWRCAGASPNAEFSEDGGITRCVTGVPQEIFNVVLRCNLDPWKIDERIDLMIDEFRSRRLTLIWHVGLLSEPRDLGRRLEARGFPHDYDLMAMAIDLQDTGKLLEPPEGVRVKVVTTLADCENWIRCLVGSWGSPRELIPWMMNNACFNVALATEAMKPLPRRMYLGSVNGKQVSTAMLVWNEHTAGLQTVGTIESARCKGVGSAVVGAAIRDACSMGFNSAVVLSTVEGVKLYNKIGFKVFGKLPEHSMDFRGSKK